MRTSGRTANNAVASGPGPGRRPAGRGRRCWHRRQEQRVRPVARARTDRDPGVRRRPPAPHAVRGRPRDRADQGGGPTLPADARGQLGYVRSDGKDFSLRPRAWSSATPSCPASACRRWQQPHLEGLAGRVHESSSMSILDSGDSVVYVARVPTKRIMRVAIAVGTRFPAYATSMGRVLLAGPVARAPGDLPRGRAPPAPDDPDRHRPRPLREIIGDVARQGFAIVDQELEEGLRAVAAPIRGPRTSAPPPSTCPRTRAGSASRPCEQNPAGPAKTARQIEADLLAQGSPTTCPLVRCRPISRCLTRAAVDSRGERVVEFYIAYSRTLSEHSASLSGRPARAMPLARDQGWPGARGADFRGDGMDRQGTATGCRGICRSRGVLC